MGDVWLTVHPSIHFEWFIHPNDDLCVCVGGGTALQVLDPPGVLPQAGGPHLPAADPRSTGRGRRQGPLAGWCGGGVWDWGGGGEGAHRVLSLLRHRVVVKQATKVWNRLLKVLNAAEVCTYVEIQRGTRGGEGAGAGVADGVAWFDEAHSLWPHPFTNHPPTTAHTTTLHYTTLHYNPLHQEQRASTAELLQKMVAQAAEADGQFYFPLAPERIEAVRAVRWAGLGGVGLGSQVIMAVADGWSGCCAVLTDSPPL